MATMRQIKANEHNIADIMSHLAKYRDQTIVINGLDIHDGRKSFTMCVERMLYSYRKLPFHIIIENLDDCSPFIRRIVSELKC